MAANSKFVFLLEKSQKLNRFECTLAQLEGRPVRIDSTFFELEFLCNSRNRRFSAKFRNFFRGSGPRYSHQNFIPGGPWGSPYNALENLEPIPKIFGKLGENVFVGGQPRGPGAKILGAALNCVGRVTRGPRGVQKEIGSELLA